MIETFVPPWDQPYWIIIDGPSLLANLSSTISSSEAVIDLRGSFLRRVSAYFYSDFKRAGMLGFLTNTCFQLVEIKKLFSEGWVGYFAPPFTSGALDAASRHGVIPIIGHTAEAIFLSNVAQSHGKVLPLLVRLRGRNLVVDAGKTGFFPLLEMLVLLPKLEVAGFFLDEPFSSRHECDDFTSALSRSPCTHRASTIIGGENGPLPVRYRKFRKIGEEILGYRSFKPNVTATLTIQAWGVPVSTNGPKINVSIDLGNRSGFFGVKDQLAFVEEVPAIFLFSEENRAVFQVSERPDKPSPWKVTILGSDGAHVVSPSDWQIPQIESFLAIMGSDCPLFVFDGNSCNAIP